MNVCKLLKVKFLKRKSPVLYAGFFYFDNNAINLQRNCFRKKILDIMLIMMTLSWKNP